MVAGMVQEVGSRPDLLELHENSQRVRRGRNTPREKA